MPRYGNNVPLSLKIDRVGISRSGHGSKSTLETIPIVWYGTYGPRKFLFSCSIISFKLAVVIIPLTREEVVDPVKWPLASLPGGCYVIWPAPKAIVCGSLLFQFIFSLFAVLLAKCKTKHHNVAVHVNRSNQRKHTLIHNKFNSALVYQYCTV